jgi:predicted PurR-regulated permease PerM
LANCVVNEPTNPFACDAYFGSSVANRATEKMIPNANPNRMVYTPATHAGATNGGLLASISGLASSFVFLLALLLFLGIESGGASDRLASIGVDRARITEALAHFAWGTRQYLLVTTVFGPIVAVLDWIALAILGIPLAITWALLSFITNYIPNIGFIIGVVPPALLGLLTGGPQLMVIVIVVYCVLNFVVQSIIQRASSATRSGCRSRSHS